MKKPPAKKVAKKIAPENSFSIFKGPNEVTKMKNEMLEDAGPIDPEPLYKTIILQFHSGLIGKREMYDTLRDLWGAETLRRTISCHGNMKSRCNAGYAHLDSDFEKPDHFLLHMGPRPHPHSSIDRIDNTKGYSPDNCRWADKTTQTRNRSNTVMLTVDGKKLPLGEWADLVGETARVLHARRAKGLSDYEVVYGERPVIRPSTKYWPPRGYIETEAAVIQCSRWTNEERRELRDRIVEVIQWLNVKGQELSVPDGYVLDAGAMKEVKKLSGLYSQYRKLLQAVDAIPRRRFD